MPYRRSSLTIADPAESPSHGDSPRVQVTGCLINGVTARRNQRNRWRHFVELAANRFFPSRCRFSTYEHDAYLSLSLSVVLYQACLRLRPFSVWNERKKPVIFFICNFQRARREGEPLAAATNAA